MRAFLGIMITAAAVCAASLSVCAQRSVMLDHNGNVVSNNEFVDVRMANPSLPDATATRTLEDGSVEFRLAKVPQEDVPAGDFLITTLDGKRISSADLK